MHSNDMCAILLLEEKNILVSGGYDGTNLWEIYENRINIKSISYFEKAICCCCNGLNRIDEDRIIIGGEETFKIISIKEMKINKSIGIPFRCNGISVTEEKGIFLIGG